jgi:hypothetical protein
MIGRGAITKPASAALALLARQKVRRGATSEAVGEPAPQLVDPGLRIGVAGRRPRLHDRRALTDLVVF